MRCVKLVKPYSKKSVLDDDDNDDDDDDEDCTREGRSIPSVGRIMEHDVLAQAYQIGRSHHVVQAGLRFNTSSVV